MFNMLDYFVNLKYYESYKNVHVVLWMFTSGIIMLCLIKTFLEIGLSSLRNTPKKSKKNIKWNWRTAESSSRFNMWMNFDLFKRTVCTVMNDCEYLF